MTHPAAVGRITALVTLPAVTSKLDPRLANLLAVWRRREDVRAPGNAAELAEARQALDAARVRARLMHA